MQMLVSGDLREFMLGKKSEECPNNSSLHHDVFILDKCCRLGLWPVSKNKGLWQEPSMLLLCFEKSKSTLTKMGVKLFL